MPSQDFIDVRVHVNDLPLREYPVPDGGDEDEQTMIRYIEVSAGQKFTIEVKLLPGFKFHFSSHVYCHLLTDNDENGLFKTLTYKDSQTRRGMLTAQSYTTFAKTAMKDDTTGIWNEYAFEFGALGIGKSRFIFSSSTFSLLADEDAPMPKDLSPADIQNLGSLRFKIYRARAKRLDQPFVVTGQMKKSLEEVAEVALKGKTLKNNVKSVIDSWFGKW